MDESERKQSQGSRKAGPQPEKKPRCDPKKLALLKKCSKKKDMTDWNNWRKANPEEEIWLQGANLCGAHLEGARLSGAHLEGARLSGGHLQGVNLIDAHLEGADLSYAHFERAILVSTHFERANLWFTHLERSELTNAYLEGVELLDAHLEGAGFVTSAVNGSTLFWDCDVDRDTDFRGVGLESCRIDEGTKYLLEYNKRRMNCQDWYKQHPRLAWPVKAFFWMSDYGRSTGRIIFTFFGLALIFAGIYYICALVNSPGIVSNLFEGKEGPVPGWLVPFRTIYFSIVTMTTLGFGDMHANCQSFWGHLLLTVQVILGYVLLGALVTRFGVLFTSGVVPGQFKQQKNAQDNARA